METQIIKIEWDGKTSPIAILENGAVLKEEQHHLDGNFLVYELEVETEIEKLITILKEKSIIDDADLVKIKDKK